MGKGKRRWWKKIGFRKSNKEEITNGENSTGFIDAETGWARPPLFIMCFG